VPLGALNAADQGFNGRSGLEGRHAGSPEDEHYARSERGEDALGASVVTVSRYLAVLPHCCGVKSS
jgi:hypothetical protein